jgi:Icc-related predicted phosphoesterase
MVKFLAAADFHGDYDVAVNLSEKARQNNIDLIVIAGDINGSTQGDERIFNPFLKNNQKILFIPGNWDSNTEHEILKKKGKSIHNYYVTYDDVSFIGFGVSNMKMKLNETDRNHLYNLFNKIKTKKKVFVSHLHIKGTKAELSGVKGDEILRETIERFSPDIVIAAHIHELEGIEDKIGNTIIFQTGRHGKIIEI